MPLSPFEKNALFQVVCDHIAANYTSLAINTAEAFFESVSAALLSNYGLERSANTWRKEYQNRREEAIAFFPPEEAHRADERLCLREVRQKNIALGKFGEVEPKKTALDFAMARKKSIAAAAASAPAPAPPQAPHAAGFDPVEALPLYRSPALATGFSRRFAAALPEVADANSTAAPAQPPASSAPPAGPSFVLPERPHQ